MPPKGKNTKQKEALSSGSRKSSRTVSKTAKAIEREKNLPLVSKKAPIVLVNTDDEEDVDDIPAPKTKGKRKAVDARADAPPVKKAAGKKVASRVVTPEPKSSGQPLTAAQKRKQEEKQKAERRKAIQAANSSLIDLDDIDSDGPPPNQLALRASKSKSKSATPTASNKGKTGKTRAATPSQPDTDDDKEDEQALGSRLSLQATFDDLNKAIAEKQKLDGDDNDNNDDDDDDDNGEGNEDHDMHDTRANPSDPDEGSSNANDDSGSEDNDEDNGNNSENANDPFGDDIMAISSPRKNSHSKNGGKKSMSATAKPSPDVVVVSGDGNPFRNGAFTLSRAAWNRCRIFIQLVNGFPKSDERQTVTADLIKDLVLGVRAYGLVWAKLAPDHRHLMVSYTWRAVAQVRGEWKRSALGPVKELYFKDFPLPDQWRERQAFAKWLLGDNADKTDAFAFDGIEYSEEYKTWDWQTPYLHPAFRALIKGQCFEFGKNPDALRNLEEFKSFTLPLIAIAATTLENCIRGYVETGIYKNIPFNDRFNSKRYQYHMKRLQHHEKKSDGYILWRYEEIYAEILQELDLGYLTANPSDVKDKTDYAALRKVPRNCQALTANNAPQDPEPQDVDTVQAGGADAPEAGPSGS